MRHWVFSSCAGTKIAAVASRKQVMTPQRIEKMNAAIDRKIVDYLASMDEADRDEPRAVPAQADVAAAIEALKAQKARLQGQAEDLAARGLKQMVMTEPDAKLSGRRMATRSPTTHRRRLMPSTS